MTDDDRIVADYLRRLRRAARGLPPARRRELVAEITAHIAEARAAAGPPPGETIQAILGRTGDPADIARAAGGPALAGRPRGLEIAAVILLLIGGFIFVIGWPVGCVLLWVSPRWGWTDKLLGTLVWPGGFAAIALALPAALLVWQSCPGNSSGLTTCTGPAIPAWLGITSLAGAVAVQVLVAIRLLRRARRIPEAELVAARAGTVGT